MDPAQLFKFKNNKTNVRAKSLGIAARLKTLGSSMTKGSKLLGSNIVVRPGAWVMSDPSIELKKIVTKEKKKTERNRISIKEIINS